MPWPRTCPRRIRPTRTLCRTDGALHLVCLWHNEDFIHSAYLKTPMPNTSMIQLIRRIDTFLSTIIDPDPFEIEIRYNDGNSGWPEQIFDCRSNRNPIGILESPNGRFRDIKKYSCKVNVTLTLSDDSDTIEQMESANGHLFIPDPSHQAITKSFIKRNNPNGFFTCMRDILIYKTDENDSEDTYVYALSYIPPNPNMAYAVRPTEDARESAAKTGF